MKKNKVLSRIVLIALLTVLISSCISPKEILYVQDIEEQIINTDLNYEPIIQKDDRLVISVASENMELVAPYNNFSVIEANSTATVTSNRPDYLVNTNGTIQFPQIGEIMLSGLSVSQAENKLEIELRKDVKDAEAEIRIVNFKFTVLGEVNNPGTFTTPDQRITLMQAIGMAGDLTIFGERSTILIIRDANGVKTTSRINLTSSDFINSDFYYLNQNDTVIVEPNKAQVQAAGANRNTTFWLGVASFLLTAVLVINNVTR